MATDSATAARKLAKAPDTPASKLAELAGQSASTDRLLAAHPNADAALLEKLSHSSDKATRKAVVLNPNAPKEVLIHLAPQFPGDFFKNPAFDWLLVEQPDLLTEIGGGVLKNILKRPECPESFLRWAARHGEEDEKKAVAMNPNTPKEALELLAADDKSSAAKAAQQHAKLSGLSSTDPEAEFLDGIRAALAALEEPGLESLPLVDDDENWFFWRLGEPADALGDRYLGLNHLALYSKAFVKLWLAMRGGHGTPADIASFARREGREVTDPHLFDYVFDELLKAARKDEKAAVAAQDILWMPPGKALKAPKHKLPVIRALGLSQPTAEAEQLIKNHKHVDWLVRAAVARHLYTPESVLRTLATDAHQTVRALAERNLARAAQSRAGSDEKIERLGKTALALRPFLDEVAKRLERARSPGDYSLAATPVAVATRYSGKLRWEALAGGQWREIFTDNPAVPEQVLEEMARDANADVRLAVAERPSCPVRLLENLARDKTFAVRKAVAEHPACPSEVLKALASDKKPEVQEAAAGRLRRVAARLRGDAAERSSCTGPILEALASDKVDWVRSHVAEKPPVPEMEQLARDKDPLVRAAVAKRNNCPDTILEILSADAEEDIRLAVAKHPTCPAAVVERLARDNDPRIRAAVARRADCPTQILAILGEDTDATVRQGVARHPGCPGHLLEALAKDTSRVTPFVGTFYGSERFNETVASSVAENPACPANVLELLANSKDWVVRHTAAGVWQVWTVRQVVGEHPASPAPLLEALSHDGDAAVRGLVARNPTCPVRLLEALAKDDDWWVRVAVMKHPSAPEEVRRQIEEQHRERLLKAAAKVQTPLQPLEWDDLQLDKVSNHSGNTLISLLCPECDKRALAKGAKSKDPFERLAAALNPSLPKSVVMRLLDDSDPAVQQAAASHSAVAK